MPTRSPLPCTPLKPLLALTSSRLCVQRGFPFFPLQPWLPCSDLKMSPFPPAGTFSAPFPLLAG